MPEEIYGPVSLNGLKNDKFIRIIEGKLPCADIAFGDEIFNASSGILNTLLKILNERVYEQGDGDWDNVKAFRTYDEAISFRENLIKEFIDNR